MKTRKIMLIAIAIIATAAGILAFKAQKFAHKNIYCATNEPLTTCKIVEFKTTNVGNCVTTPCEISHAALGLTTTSYYTTSTCATPVSGCVTVTIIQ